MQSPDWPDLPFIKPAAYGTGRDGRQAMVSVVHYTAGSERSTSAEDGAAYDARRTDGTSTHYFHDQNSTIQCVRLADRANACFHHGNRLGIQHELCGTQQARSQWLDEASRATIRRAAFQIARDHKRLGIPVRRLTPAQVRACWYDGAPGGICGHADVTLAFPEDDGSHMDPGSEFPWDVLLADVDYFVNGGDDMPRDYNPYSVPAPVGNRPDSVLLADLWGAEMLGGSPYDVTSKSPRLQQLSRLETKLDAALTALGLAQADIDELQARPAVDLPALAAALAPLLDGKLDAAAVLGVLQSPEGQAALVQAQNTAEDS